MKPEPKARPEAKMVKKRKITKTGDDSVYKDRIQGIIHCRGCGGELYIFQRSFPIKLSCHTCKKTWVLSSDRSAIQWLPQDAEIKKVFKNIIVIGNPAVGKTSLIRRFAENKFDNKYRATIGTKITKKVFELPVEAGGKVEMIMLLWDVTDQKGDYTDQSKAYKEASGVLLVCDILRKDTMQSLQDYWIPNLLEVAGRIPIIFVANKVDLLYGMDYSMEELDQIMVSSGEIEKVIAKHNAPFLRTSALSGENVDEAFMTISKLAL